MIIGASVIGTLTVAVVGLFLTLIDLGEIQEQVEATSRGQTELIGKLSIDSIIGEDRPALQTLVDGLKTLDSGLDSIQISNQDGTVLASWRDQKEKRRLVRCSQPINYVGQSFGRINTRWDYGHFAVPIIQAKVRSTLITLAVLLLVIIGLAILLQYYLIHPLHYLEEKVRRVGESTVAPDQARPFVSRELRSLNQTLDEASIVLAEKAKAEAEMLTERARAEDAEAEAQAKMDFLSLMSHEIRTPLGAMMGFGQLLESATLNEEERGFLNNLNSSGSFLLHVINDILDLSKIEAEGIKYESRPMKPNRLIQKVKGMTSSLALEKGVHLECRTSGLDNRQVHGDQHRIMQVLVNLVGNAIKFTDEGEVRIRVDALDSTPSQDGMARIRFEVTDTGIGMTEEQCKQIFAPFSQADSTVTRRFGGTGLGLSVSTRLVEGMGGELCVTSEPDQGSVFYFELSMPIEESVAQEERLATLGVEAEGGGLKILVAEDELVNRILIEKFISNFGHEIELVADGRACLERLEQGIDFDVLFVDLHMPYVGGLEIVQSLRGGAFGKRGEELNLAIMSADVLAEDESRDLGVDAFISKPIDLPSLKNFLTEVHAGKEGVDEVVEPPCRPEALDRQLRVLVVEDQPLNRCLLEKLLARQGVESSLAEDGIECLEFLETQPDVDAILMDWRMPRMDGISAARQIRSGAFPAFTNIPIAMVSAEVLDRPDLDDLNIAEFIPKPLDLTKLSSFFKAIRDSQTAVAISG